VLKGSEENPGETQTEAVVLQVSEDVIHEMIRYNCYFGVEN
jgi:hypothetical protein